MLRRHLPAILGATILISQLFQSLLLSFSQSSRRVTDQVVAVGCQSVMQFGFLCLVIFVAKGKELSALTSIFLGYLVGIFILLRRRGNSGNRPNAGFWPSGGDLFKKLYRYGMPMCLWFFATQFYSIGDRLILKYIRTPAEVGQYASFKDLSIGCAGFLTMPLLLASHPIIMMMWKKGCGKDEIENLIARNIALISLFFAPLLVLIHVCGTDLLSLVLGPKYLLDKRVMFFVVLSLYISSMSMYVQKGLEVTGKTLVMAKVALLIASFSFFANVVSIPRFGILGASLVVIVSQLLYIRIIWGLTKETLTVRFPLHLIGKLFIWVAAVELICRVFPYFLFPSGLAILLFYFRLMIIALATLYLYVTSEEIRSLWNFFRFDLRRV
jgi:O-antigen/teichoic acid export membrane protein